MMTMCTWPFWLKPLHICEKKKCAAPAVKAMLVEIWVQLAPRCIVREVSASTHARMKSSLAGRDTLSGVQVRLGFAFMIEDGLQLNTCDHCANVV